MFVFTFHPQFMFPGSELRTLVDTAQQQPNSTCFSLWDRARNLTINLTLNTHFFTALLDDTARHLISRHVYVCVYIYIFC